MALLTSTDALTKVKGCGRRYANIVAKKADIDLNLRAGELTAEQLERIVSILQAPTQYKIPSVCFWNRFSSSFLLSVFRFLYTNALCSGSLTVSATLSTARTRRSWPTVSTPSSVRIWSASRRSVPPRSPSLLGPACARPAHQDDRSSRPDCRCVQEEGWLKNDSGKNQGRRANREWVPRTEKQRTTEGWFYNVGTIHGPGTFTFCLFFYVFTTAAGIFFARALAAGGME